MSMTTLESVSHCDTHRGRASAWTLIREAAGSPRDVVRKARALLRGLLAYLDHGQTLARLERLKELGHIDQIPSRIQRVVGSADMLRFWISPNAADYYRSRGIGYGLHQVLRVLDDPLSMTDPLGFLSERDVIVGHLMQVVHANPVYDLQLLESYDGGIDELVLQLREMVAGRHPRQESIGAIVEEADYHARLLDYTLRWRTDPATSRCSVKTCCSPRTGLRWTRPLAACPRRSRTCVRCPPPGVVPSGTCSLSGPFRDCRTPGRPDLADVRLRCGRAIHTC